MHECRDAQAGSDLVAALQPTVRLVVEAEPGGLAALLHISTFPAFYQLDKDRKVVDSAAFTVRAGHVYTLVVNGTGRQPIYYDAEVYPGRPHKRDNAFHRAGHHRWTLGVYMQPSLRSHRYWNIGVRIGGTMHVLKIRVV